jgi:hypothetical protein
MARSHIPLEVERRVRLAAKNRCGYCLSPQHLVMARLEIEHIVPVSKQGSSDESNWVFRIWYDIVIVYTLSGICSHS